MFSLQMKKLVRVFMFLVRFLGSNNGRRRGGGGRGWQQQQQEEEEKEEEGLTQTHV